MKYLLITLTALLTGCSSMDHVVCYGTGTCNLNPQYRSATPAQYVSPTPQTLITSQGTYMVIRDQTSGTISSIIQTSRAK